MRILVVDPDADNRDSWSQLLTCWGHQVSVAADAPTALQQCQAFRPEAVLTEVVLPGADGWQLGRRLRARCALLVAITGYSLWDGPARAEAAGFDFFLTKPAEPAAVQQILARAEVRAGAGLERAPFRPEEWRSSHLRVTNDLVGQCRPGPTCARADLQVIGQQ